jgi:hypothetical protein
MGNLSGDANAPAALFVLLMGARPQLARSLLSSASVGMR